MQTAREEVLEAFRRLERRHGQSVFSLSEIVHEVLREHPTRNESTIRTHVSSVMCREAPVNHANHMDDLERMGPGMYRRIIAIEG